MKKTSPPAAKKKKASGNPALAQAATAFGADASGAETSSPSSDTLVAAAGFGGPLELAIGLIDEDPFQPRTKDNPGFSNESLEELAASIRLRGVKTPISVRNNPNALGRYVINHGARRYRGSKRAGKTTVPAFIDNDYNHADQIVENLQRNELTAREIADFIGRELARGVKKIEIARTISKSQAYVTQHVTLLDLPDVIAAAFNSGRVRDVTVVNELVTAYKKNPGEVADWLDDENQEITRGSVKLLREFLEEKKKREPPEDDGAQSAGDGSGGESDNLDADDAAPLNEKQDAADKLRRVVVHVQHNRRPARLILNRRPPAEGFAWLKYDDDGHEIKADLAKVRLVALMEG